MGSVGRRSERTVHQPYPHPDWREVRQDCRSSSLALAVAERRNHHHEDRSQGTNAGESESLRLQLDAEDMQAIAKLDTAHSLFLDHHSGETTKQAACTTWLNANRPSEKNGLKGTADYQRVQKLKRAFAFSNINQVIYKYMDDKGNIKLPESTTTTTKPGSGVGGGGEIET